MNTKNNQLEKALSQGYELDFGKVIEKSFENFKKTWAMGGLAMLIILLLLGALSVGAIVVILGLDALTDMANLENFANLENQLRLSTMDTLYLFLYTIGIALLYGLSYVLFAGFYKMVDDADKNKPIVLDSLFYYFRTNHFVQLLFAGVLYSFTTTLLGYAFDHMENPAIGGIIVTLLNYIIIFLMTLVIPLIIFSNNKALSAIENSIKLVLKQPLIILALIIVAGLLSAIGLFAICIGYLFTFAFNYIVYYYIYISALPQDESSDLDLIGSKDEE